MIKMIFFLIIILSMVASISAQSQLPNDLLRQMVSDGLDCPQTMEIGVEKFASEYLTLKKNDLNRDSQQEFIIYGSGSMMCFGQQTHTWIYRKVNNSWKALLIQGSGIVTANKTSSNKFLDITLRSEKLLDLYVHTYKFDGKHYQLCSTKWFTRSNANRKFALEQEDKGNCN